MFIVKLTNISDGKMFFLRCWSTTLCKNCESNFLLRLLLSGKQCGR